MKLRVFHGRAANHPRRYGDNALSDARAHSRDRLGDRARARGRTAVRAFALRERRVSAFARADGSSGRPPPLRRFGAALRGGQPRRRRNRDPEYPRLRRRRPESARSRARSPIRAAQPVSHRCRRDVALTTGSFTSACSPQRRGPGSRPIGRRATRYVTDIEREATA